VAFPRYYHLLHNHHPTVICQGIAVSLVAHVTSTHPAHYSSSSVTGFPQLLRDEDKAALRAHNMDGHTPLVTAHYHLLSPCHCPVTFHCIGIDIATQSLVTASDKSSLVAGQGSGPSIPEPLPPTVPDASWSVWSWAVVRPPGMEAHRCAATGRVSSSKSPDFPAHHQLPGLRQHLHPYDSLQDLPLRTHIAGVHLGVHLGLHLVPAPPVLRWVSWCIAGAATGCRLH